VRMRYTPHLSSLGTCFTSIKVQTLTHAASLSPPLLFFFVASADAGLLSRWHAHYSGGKISKRAVAQRHSVGAALHGFAGGGGGRSRSAAVACASCHELEQRLARTGRIFHAQHAAVCLHLRPHEALRRAFGILVKRVN
jgi:hypothetical protein